MYLTSTYMCKWDGFDCMSYQCHFSWHFVTVFDLWRRIGGKTRTFLILFYHSDLMRNSINIQHLWTGPHSIYSILAICYQDKITTREIADIPFFFLNPILQLSPECLVCGIIRCVRSQTNTQSEAKWENVGEAKSMKKEESITWG